MAFCTKCGQQLIDGQPHNCPAAPQPQPQPQPQGGYNGQNGYGAGNSTVIDKEAVKEKAKDIVHQMDQAGQKIQDLDNSSSYERGLKIVPQIIAANDGEVPVKQYNVAKLRSRITLSKAEGRLQVTNKRVIFRATGRSIMGKVALHQEFKIDELAGIEFRNRPEFNLFNFFMAYIVAAIFAAPGVLLGANVESAFLAVIFAILGVVAIAAWIAVAIILRKTKALNKFYTLRLAILALLSGGLVGSIMSADLDDFGEVVCWIIFGILVLLALINIFLIAFVPNLLIKIKTKGAHSGIEVVKEEPVALLGMLFGNKNREDASGFLEVLPWSETELAMREIGTIIDDIQTLGDAAIEKWKQD